MAFRPTLELVFSTKDLEGSGLSVEEFKAQVDAIFVQQLAQAILRHDFATGNTFALRADGGAWVLNEKGEREFEVTNWSSPVVGRFERDGVLYAQTASGDVVAVVPTFDF